MTAPGAALAFSRDQLDKDAVFAAFDYHPTAMQQPIHASKAKYRYVACGIRWGKTFVASREALAELLVPGSRGWIVAPTYQLGQYAFREIYWNVVRHLPKEFVRAASERDMYLKTAINSEVYVKTASNEESLIGESLDWLIIDEAARVSKEAYELARGRLVDRDGWLLAISSPAGRNWFEEGFRRGQDREANPDWESWTAPTWTNPFLKPEVLEEIKRTAPERTWRQDYCAEFLDDDGLVFKNVDACATLPYTKDEPKAERGTRYLVSWDVGKYQDFSVVCVWDVRKKCVVFMERFQGDWPVQAKRVRDLARRFNKAEIHMDASGEGDAVFTMLYEQNRSDGFARRVCAVRLHDARLKRDLIEGLALGMEKLALSYPKHPALLKELRMYEYERKEKSGQLSYHAPVGYHDDCVMALALGWAQVGSSKSSGRFRMG